MSDDTSTRLNIRQDRPTAISSSTHGSNIDAVGFNVSFIALKNPKLAIELLRIYAEAHQINKNDTEAPEEDYILFTNELKNDRNTE